jgi:type IV secretion system protein VirB10
VPVTRSLPRLALSCLILLALAACDDKPHARQAQKKLALPQSESTLDSMLKKPPPPAPAPPHLEAEPDSYDFAPQPAGGAAQGRIRLSNSGGESLTLGGLRLAGQTADFTLAGECRAGLVLAPGAACVADIRYHPRQSGRILAELVVDQGAAGPSLFVPVSGEALDLAPIEQQRGAAQARASLIYASARQAAPLAISAAPDHSDEPPSSPDYADAGLPGVVSGFPVDRSRVLTADRYIPAVLENTLNSELPGRAIAVVERPVFGEDDRFVLIPAGSRVIGSYKSGAKYGQARLDISWSRILRPDGAIINIEAGAADVMGRAGVPGDLDSRLVEKYGSSFLTSVIAAAGTWALAGTSTVSTSALGTTETLSPRAQAANRLGTDTDNLAQRMVQDNVDIRPVLTVPAGTRLVIVPSEDIWLRDPTHLRAVTPPKEARNQIKGGTGALMELLPSLVDTVAQNPAVQKAMPQTATQLMQSSLLQQLRTDPTLGGALGTPTSSSSSTSPSSSSQATGATQQ